MEVCQYRSWRLHALHVRTNHVHGVVDADQVGSRVLNDWKAYATRALRASGRVASDRIVWTHGGAVQIVRSREHFDRVIRYVLEAQGEPMEVCANFERLTPP